MMPTAYLTRYRRASYGTKRLIFRNVLHLSLPIYYSRVLFFFHLVIDDTWCSFLVSPKTISTGSSIVTKRLCVKHPRLRACWTMCLTEPHHSWRDTEQTLNLINYRHTFCPRTIVWSLSAEFLVTRPLNVTSLTDPWQTRRQNSGLKHDWESVRNGQWRTD